MYSQLAATNPDSSSPGTFLDPLIHDYLPAFALGAGLMAVIWIACALIALAGAFIGGIVFVILRNLTLTCVWFIRRRQGVEHDQVSTVDTEGGHATLVDLDHYRDRQHSHSKSRESDEVFHHCCDDDPA